MIDVENIRKTFEVSRVTGRRMLVLPRRETQVVTAVRGISFSVPAGGRVAFIGPNGAGKSTTLKMLSGILRPTSGHARVAGYVPWESRQVLARDIGLVFGQRSQLWPHLPVRDSFDMLGKIYGLTTAAYTEQLARLEAMFHLSPLLTRATRSLSLGQRMRCEIAASLLHRPRLLFLDEPTIGLDVTAKAELRDHLLALGQSEGTTIILTSHDTDDIEQICDRVILIDQGEKLVDMPIAEMRRTLLSRRRLIFTTGEESPALTLPGLLSSEASPYRLSVEIDPAHTPVPAVIAAALGQLTIHDVTVTDTPLEDIIRHVYATGRGA